MPSIRESVSTLASGLDPDEIQSVRPVDWRTHGRATGDRSPVQGNDAYGDVVVVMSAEARAMSGDDRSMSRPGSSAATPFTPADTPTPKPNWGSPTPDGKPLQAPSELQVERHVAWQSTDATPPDPSDPVAWDGAAPAADPAVRAADPEI